MTLAPSMIRMTAATPDWPTTWPRRRNMITPRMVSVQGVNTPPKVPNFFSLFFFFFFFFLSIFLLSFFSPPIFSYITDLSGGLAIIILLFSSGVTSHLAPTQEDIRHPTLASPCFLDRPICSFHLASMALCDVRDSCLLCKKTSAAWRSYFPAADMGILSTVTIRRGRRRFRPCPPGPGGSQATSISPFDTASTTATISFSRARSVASASTRASAIPGRSFRQACTPSRSTRLPPTLTIPSARPMSTKPRSASP